MAVLSLQELTKSFSSPLLRGVSFDREAGSCTLLLGANGAGKTTLLRLAAGLLRADSGSVLFDGELLTPSRVGYVSHRSMLYDELTVRENLDFFCSLQGATVDYEDAAQRWALHDALNTKVKSLSQGMQAKVSLIRAFASNADVLLLDEPSAALDQSSVMTLHEEIQRVITGGSIVLLATHDVERLRASASSAILLDAGIVGRDSLEGEMGEVLSLYRARNR